MLKQARFSEGQETASDSREKSRVGRFSDGQARVAESAGCGCGVSCTCG